MDEQREIERLEDRSEYVEEQIDKARADWERKKADDSVPGATDGVADGPPPEADFPGDADVPDDAAEADRIADEHAED